MCGIMNPVTQALKGKLAVPGPLFDERIRRLWAAAEARSIGRGGVSRVAEATGWRESRVDRIGNLDGPQARDARNGRSSFT